LSWELLLLRRHELLACSKRGAELICWEPFCKQMHGGRMHPLEFHNGTDVERTAPVQAAALWRLSRLRHPPACHKTQRAIIIILLLLFFFIIFIINNNDNNNYNNNNNNNTKSQA